MYEKPRSQQVLLTIYDDCQRFHSLVRPYVTLVRVYDVEETLHYILTKSFMREIGSPDVLCNSKKNNE